MSTPSRKPTAPLFGRWTPKNDFVFGRWTPSVKSVKGKKEETATSSERHEKREFGSALSQQHINQLIGGDNPTQQRRPGFVNLDKLKALIAHNDAEDQAEEERGCRRRRHKTARHDERRRHLLSRRRGRKACHSVTRRG